MAGRIAKKTMYFTADRSRLVAEDDPEAAYLFVRAGSPIDDEAEAKRLGYKDTEDAPVYDAKAEHALAHATDAPIEESEDVGLKAVLSTPENKAAAPAKAKAKE